MWWPQRSTYQLVRTQGEEDRDVDDGGSPTVEELHRKKVMRRIFWISLTLSFIVFFILDL